MHAHEESLESLGNVLWPRELVRRHVACHTIFLPIKRLSSVTHLLIHQIKDNVSLFMTAERSNAAKQKGKNRPAYHILTLIARHTDVKISCRQSQMTQQ